MIFKQLKTLGIMLLLSTLTPLWADCPLALTNAIITPAPMEYKGVGNIQFFISEEDGLSIPAEDTFGEATCQFVVDLNKIVPKDNDISLIIGKVTTYFDISYEPINNQVHFEQKLEIPANEAIEIKIPIDVIAQSPSSNPFNGFITNIHASSESIEQYTSTKKAILKAVLDNNASVDGDAGGIAITNITLNDTINDKNITLGGDVTITSVTEDTPLIINKDTGEVSVASGTKRGTYTEQYTLCETYDTSNCSEANVTVVVNSVIAAPVITTVDQSNETTTITANTKPEISGACEVNLTVILSIDDTEITPTTTCKSDGTFSIIPENPLSDGDHVIVAVQQDGTQVSPKSNEKTVTVDTTPPGKPTVVIVEDKNNDGIISKANELEGNVDITIAIPTDAEVGDILTITHLDGKEDNITITQENIDNGYAFEHAVVSDGETITITAKVTDKLGNISESDSDTAKIVNDIKPNAPVITAMDENSSDIVNTANNKPQISGTCEANATVTVQIDGGAISPTTTCTAEGTFSLIPEAQIADGEHAVTAIQVGENGVLSDPSPTDTLIVDTIAPTKPTVEIVEDSNNDGEISKLNELDGAVDVTISIPNDANIGDILTITQPDGNQVEVPLTLEMINKGVYAVGYTIVDNVAEDVNVTVKATLTDTVGNVSDMDEDTAVIVNDLLPDYDVDIMLNKTTVENVSTLINMVVTISEMTYGVNSGDLTFALTKNLNFKIDFDDTLTTLSGKTLRNNEWKLDSETSTSYTFKYIGDSGKYPSKTRMRIGFTGLFTPPETVRGKFIMNARIKNGSGDTNSENNKDSDAVIYSNIK